MRWDFVPGVGGVEDWDADRVVLGWLVRMRSLVVLMMSGRWMG